ncbi:hypothetical protein [uncultured Rikenella sp.]|uniref:hypothetical protein n=1 Tax=uncultured Rikenella sp. TaxID=368003 RepID=UPI00272BC935|nr:hypothetical protein [uncultured Rikenella sp.]
MDTRYNYKVAQWIDNVSYLWGEFMILSESYYDIIKLWYPFSGCRYYSEKEGKWYLDIMGFPFSLCAIMGKQLKGDRCELKKIENVLLSFPSDKLLKDISLEAMTKIIHKSLGDFVRSIKASDKYEIGSGLLVNRKEIEGRMDYIKNLIPHFEYCHPSGKSFELTAYYVMAHIRNEMAQLDAIGRHGYLLQYLTPSFVDSIDDLPEGFSYAKQYVRQIIGRDVWDELKTARDVIIWEMSAIIRDFNLNISHLEESAGGLTSIIEAKNPDAKDKETKGALLTTAQRVLFLKHALGEMGVFISERNGDGGVSQRDIARLIHVILGGNAEKIENTSIYKAIKKSNQNTSEHDAEKLRQVIEKMGFSGLANQLK